MSDVLLFLIAVAVLGLGIGAGSAWLGPRQVRPRDIRRLRRFGIAREPGSVRWVSDWYTGTARIGDPCLVVKDGQVLIVDTDDRIVAWLPSPYDKESTVYMASGYRCLTANDGKPKQVYNTLGGGGGY